MNVSENIHIMSEAKQDGSLFAQLCDVYVETRMKLLGLDAGCD